MANIEQLILLLLFAVILVPLFARLGLGPVLGYLFAGILVGPWVLAVFHDVERILHFAEYGVVLLLFVIGLELRPTRLWALKGAIFGFGAMQLGLTGALLGGCLVLLGFGAVPALVTGTVLALSSTAFALQIMAQRGELTTRWGRSAFATLLFQDLAVVPLLALIPLLAGAGTGEAAGWREALWALGALVATGLGGRYLLRFTLRLAALSQVREILTASALLVAFGAAWIMQAVGLSMALGAFLAGVLLADSEFRHQLEADIEPFKGLLLGLFFISVGMSLNLGLLASRPGDIALLVLVLVGVKLAVLALLGRATGLVGSDALKLGIVLSQGGEFAFVLFGEAFAGGLISALQSQSLVLAVSLSMVVTPLLFLLCDRLGGRGGDSPEFDHIEEQHTPVIIIGFGRFGQIAARILAARRIPFTALDASHRQVDFVRQYGNEIYYGDGSRLDLLEAAGAAEARLLVLAIDDPDTSVRAATLIGEHFPNLRIYARARDRRHAYRLMDVGVTTLYRETFLSALALTRELLLGLGFSAAEADRTVERFREHDERRLHRHGTEHTDEQKMISLAREAARELEEMFASDAEDLGDPDGTDRA